MRRGGTCRRPCTASRATPLALNLEYLITAYGEEEREEVAHFFLGQAMRVLHDVPIVPRARLEEVLKKAGVHRQIDRVTVTPRPLSIEEISKLWSVFQTQYRVSCAYLVTVVLIDSKSAAHAALPVLKRGSDDRGVTTVVGGAPVLDTVRPASGFNAVRLGETLSVFGARLDAGVLTAKVRHRPVSPAATPAPERPLPVTVVNASQVTVRIPAAADAPGIAAEWPAGVYSIRLEVARPEQDPWLTNDVPFMLAPSIVASPKTVQPPVASFELTVEAKPQVRDGQTVRVLFDGVAVEPKPIPAPANPDAPSIVKSMVPGNATGFHRVRLRVDGIDSIPVKKTGDVVEFDPDQSVEVKT
jgi:Pvc16 N-terminal domain